MQYIRLSIRPYLPARLPSPRLPRFTLFSLLTRAPWFRALSRTMQRTYGSATYGRTRYLPILQSIVPLLLGIRSFISRERRLKGREGYGKEGEKKMKEGEWEEGTVMRTRTRNPVGGGSGKSGLCGGMYRCLGGLMGSPHGPRW